MTGLLELSGPSFPPAAGGAARQLVILLHGWGADGNDLIQLAPEWARFLPHAEFLSPHAPYPCDIGVGRQWFAFHDQSEEMMRAAASATAPMLNAFVDDALQARRLTEADLALIGFSQGTMMSLYVAPRRPNPCAAVVGYSGLLIGGDRLVREIKSRPKVLLVHGEADELVPAAALARAVEGLEAAGVPVESHIRPGLGHGMDSQGIILGGRFLSRAFAA